MSQQQPDLKTEIQNDTSLEDLKADLVNTFKRLHLQQLTILEGKIASLEETCTREIKTALTIHTKKQLETQFPKVAEACYSNLLKHLDPLLKQAQQNVGRLNTEIYRTNELCAEIQRKYNFRWDKPFLILILTTALSGTFVALFLFLMQTSPLALFLMDAKAREAYDYGLRHIIAMEKWEALPQAEKDALLGKVSSPAPAAKQQSAVKKGSKKKSSR